MHTYQVDYLFNEKPRSHRFDLKQPELTVQDAAMHLLMLHFGDGENSLIMPTAEATATEVLEQAGRVGISRVRVVSIS